MTQSTDNTHAGSATRLEIQWPSPAVAELVDELLEHG